MKSPIVTRGKNITALQMNLNKEMDGDDATQLIDQAERVVQELPDVTGDEPSRQGLLLGLVQSGKTYAFTATIALAADNNYRCIIVLTSDNTFLYQQTLDRLQGDLPGVQVVGKDDWDNKLTSISGNLKSPDNGVVLVATKNATVLSKLISALNNLKYRSGGQLPIALIIDDEADQASLDTRANKRAADPTIEPGRINDLITNLRRQFVRHTFLQVTATPQALFLQDQNHLYRPQFTILSEPGKGYVGGETFFSLLGGQAEQLIRHIDQHELTEMAKKRINYATNIQAIPKSLREAICTFYVGATIIYLRESETKLTNQLAYSFLCHISFKKDDHSVAYDAIDAYCQYVRDGVSSIAPKDLSMEVEQELRAAYADLQEAQTSVEIPRFDTVFNELQKFIVSTDIQVLNSDRSQKQPSYKSRYNILIGGTKLARGVTIKNLLVTYYGRQAKTTNMDTMLQHARMYGYRQAHLPVTRLFITPEVEERFKLINESEQALRQVVKQYPNEEYRGIHIGRPLRATRGNILNPNNIGAYTGGRAYFPQKPEFRRSEVEKKTLQIDQKLDKLYPSSPPRLEL